MPPIMHSGSAVRRALDFLSTDKQVRLHAFTLFQSERLAHLQQEEEERSANLSLLLERTVDEWSALPLARKVSYYEAALREPPVRGEPAPTLVTMTDMQLLERLAGAQPPAPPVYVYDCLTSRRMHGNSPEGVALVSRFQQMKETAMKKHEVKVLEFKAKLDTKTLHFYEGFVEGRSATEIEAILKRSTRRLHLIQLVYSAKEADREAEAGEPRRLWQKREGKQRKSSRRSDPYPLDHSRVWIQGACAAAASQEREDRFSSQSPGSQSTASGSSPASEQSFRSSSSAGVPRPRRL